MGYGKFCLRISCPGLIRGRAGIHRTKSFRALSMNYAQQISAFTKNPVGWRLFSSSGRETLAPVTFVNNADIGYPQEPSTLQDYDIALALHSEIGEGR